MTQLNRLPVLTGREMGEKEGRRKVGEKSERQGGIRKVRGRSQLETVWKREGSALKEVILKGAPREWTGRSQRGGGEVKPPLIFFCPYAVLHATWATEGLKSSGTLRVGVVEESLHFVADISGVF